MSGIRPVSREDLPAVAALYEAVMRSGGSTPPSGLVPYFERTLLDQPWADPELPSLVYEARDGRLAGFVGAHVRRIEIDGRPGRLVCAGQLISEPAARKRGAGAMLLRELHAGSQDVTITDGATPEVAAIWTALGGATSFVRSTAWTRFFRPASAVGERLLRRDRVRGLARLSRPLWPVADAAARRATRPAVPEGGEPPAELTPDLLLEHAPRLAEGARVRVTYDAPYLEWLFREMAAVETRGELVRRAVRRDGQVVGWYVAYLAPGRLGQVMALAAAPRAVDYVIDTLFTDAWERGSAGLEGRLERSLFEPLSRRRCLLRFGVRALVRSPDAALQDALAAGGGELTRLDGEWWMGHHTEPLRS
jgi:hypothetical protein